MSLYGLLVFSAIYLLAVATPGPGVAAVIARAATGLAALAQTAQTLFVVVKYAGAAYLLYLAYRLWTAPAEVASDDVKVEAGQKPFQLFLGSFALTMANPKVMVFFLALLPTVVSLEELTVVGFIEIVIAISIVLPLVL